MKLTTGMDVVTLCSSFQVIDVVVEVVVLVVGGGVDFSVSACLFCCC